MPGPILPYGFFPADRDRCRDTSQSQEHHGKGTLHTIVVPGLRRGRSDRQDFNTSLLKPADRAFLMLAAAFGCRGILVDHPLKFMGGNILLLAAIGTNIPMVILVSDIQSELLLCASAHFA